MAAATGCASVPWAFADEHPDDVLAGIYLDRVVGFMLEPRQRAGMGLFTSAKVGMPSPLAASKVTLARLDERHVVRLDFEGQCPPDRAVGKEQTRAAIGARKETCQCAQREVLCP